MDDNRIRYGLTEIQKAYLIGRNDSFELSGVGTHLYSEVETSLNIYKLNESINKVIKRHPILHTVFDVNNQQQIVLNNYPEYTIDYKDISYLSKSKQDEYIKSLRDILSHQVFDPTVWPMFELKAVKLSDDINYLFFSFDMLIGDGFSVRLFESELLDYYYDKDNDLPEIDYTFREYIYSYEELLRSKKYERAEKYHLNRIETLPLGPSLPLNKSTETIEKPHFKRLQFDFTENDWIKFKEIAKEYNVTPTVILCTLYTEILNLWSTEDQYTLNITIFNRYPFHKNVNKIMGDFTSVMLLDIDKSIDYTGKSKFKYYQSRIIELLGYRYYDGVKLLRELAKYRSLGGKAPAPVVFTSMLYDRGIEKINENDRLGKFIYGLSQTPQVLLDNQVSDINNHLLVIWDYVDDVFDEYVINTMFNQYIQSIESFIKTGQISNIVIPERDLNIIEEYNLTQSNIENSTLDQLFASQCIKNKNKLCVVCEKTKYTYQQLDEQSNRVANYIIECGVNDKERVGVIVDRHCDTIAILLGVLKAGCAYVPIEPSLPEERIENILKQSNSKICLGIDMFKSHDFSQFNYSFVHRNSTPNDLAYIIFTSGSSGAPKGVMIKHSSVVNTIIDVNNKFNVTEKDSIIGLSSMGFDLSVYDIFGTLSVGATLYIVPDIRDVNHISDIISEYQITFWNSVPSVMNLLLEGLMNSDKKFIQYECMRNILLSGDWIPVSLPEKIRKYFPNANITSLGGATEASIWSIYFPIREINPKWKSIPYGYPLNNQMIYILNSSMQLCPIEVEGEIFIGGIGVAAGYIGDESKTKSSFIHHPELGLLYRTGDFGVMRKEGYIEFRGRKDSQIKIKGHRIELGEIENHLNNYPGIKHSIADVYEHSFNDRRIIAYIVKNEGSSTSTLSEKIIKEYLSKKIPQYMIPSIIREIEYLPLTNNQKIDRKKLPKLEIDNKQTDLIVNNKLNDTETIIYNIWKEVLNVNNFDENESFFEAGGDSLGAYQVMQKIENTFNLKLPIHILYKTPTVRGISSFVNERIISSKYKNTKGVLPVYWNPFCMWKINDGKLFIDDEEIILGKELFPQFYFETQKGIRLDALYKAFKHEQEKTVSSFVDIALKKRYIINNLPDTNDIFKNLSQFVNGSENNNLLVDFDKYQEFKNQIMNRDNLQTGLSIPLANQHLGKISERRTWRNFNHSKPIKFDVFSKLLSVFKQYRSGNKYLYNYASAGGLYPIDIYLYIKENRVENIDKGLYYYHPSSHTLKIVTNKEIDNSSSYHKNKKIFDNSAVTLYFIYNPNVNMPIYGGIGYYYAILDTGIMVSTLTAVCESNEIGVCSIGELDFERISDLFKLNNQKYLHSVEIGLKAESFLSFEDIVGIPKY